MTVQTVDNTTVISSCLFLGARGNSFKVSCVYMCIIQGVTNHVAVKVPGVPTACSLT